MADLTPQMDRPLYDRLPQLRAWRQELHRHPELAFKEHRTSAFVVERLRSFGLTPEDGIGGTGVVVAIDGALPGKSIGFRADMDALPMQDQGGKPYASEVAGRAHACGHDGHTVALLAFAQQLAENRPRSGRVILIFQPAEEIASGAMAMLQAGLLKRYPMDELYAFHNMPALASGTAAVVPGTTLNGACVWEIEIKGVGGHGAAFYETVDPLQAAARLVVEISSLVGRYANPADTVLVTVGQIEGGSAPNIIPANARVSGTLRARELPPMRALLERLDLSCQGIERLTGCDVTLRVMVDVPPCVNAVEQSVVAATACKTILGAKNVHDCIKPLPFTDDIAHFLSEVPGAYFFLGQDGVMCHHPTFDFDDNLLPVAAEIFQSIVQQRLG